ADLIACLWRAIILFCRAHSHRDFLLGEGEGLFLQSPEALDGEKWHNANERGAVACSRRARSYTVLDGAETAKPLVYPCSTTRSEKTPWMRYARRLGVVNGALVRCLTTPIRRVQ